LFSLAGLGGIVGTLIGHKRVSVSREECINLSVCRGCSAFEGCGLPQALSAKQVQAKR
jgi:hypothetical protein